MNLYLKYRPKTIDELDLDHVRKVLNDIVKSNSVHHAYLLTGPRGAGKTSTARILARLVNCEKAPAGKLSEPCNECSACRSILDGNTMDVIEIDAASNRGIDDIRELKEKIRLSPTSLRRKIYIIDEVHMLTTEAFNALLKTLEEPPSHSLFILCTTELHKVPETIVSRCVQIQFSKATSEEMQRSFARVIKGEGKQVTSEALAYLAGSVDGSFRDGVKILGQVLANHDQVELSDIEQVISGSAGYKITGLVTSLALKDAKKSLQLLSEANKNGVDANYLIVSIMRGLRDKLMQGEIAVDVAKFIFALDEVARRMTTSLDGELLLQVAIVEWCGSTLAGSNQSPNNNNQTSKPVNPVGQTASKSETQKASEPVSQKTEISETQENRKSETPNISLDGASVWKQILSSIGNNNLALDTILSKARPGKIHGDELSVYVQYDFHRQQLMSEKNLVKLEQLISNAVGRPMRVKCEVAPNEVKSDLSAQAGKGQVRNEEVALSSDDTIDDAMAIFSN